MAAVLDKDAISEQRQISDFIDRESRAKREWTASASVSLHQYRSIFHTRHAPTEISYTVDPNLINGVVPVPLVPRITDLASATIMSEPSNWCAVPAGPGFDDYYAAEAKSIVLREHESRNPVHVINMRIARSLMLTGTAFKRLFVEEEPVPVELPPESLEMWAKMKEDYSGKPVQVLSQSLAPNGRVRVYTPCNVTKEEFMSPFSVLTETGCMDLEACNQFVFCEVVPLSRIIERFPKFDIGRLRGESIADKHSVTGTNGGTVNTGYGGHSQQTGDSFGPDARLLRVYDCWKRVGPREWLHIVLIGDKLRQMAFSETVPFHPYLDYHAGQIDDYFWSESIIRRIQPLQHSINRHNTDLIENFHRSMKDAILVDTAQRKTVGNHYGQVIQVNPKFGFTPRRLEMPLNTHTALQNMMNMHIGFAYDTAGLSDVSRGIVKTHQTNEALQTARSADASPLYVIRRLGIDAPEKRKCAKVLQLAQHYYDEPRYVACAGPNLGSMYHRVVTDADLEGGTDVALVDSVMLPQGAAQRFDLMMKVATAGLFQPGPEGKEMLDRAQDFIRMDRGLLPQPSEERIETERAICENEWIAAGFAAFQQPIPLQGAEPTGPMPTIYVGPEAAFKWTPLLQATDNDEIHVREHQNAIRSGKFVGNPKAQAAAQNHLSEHVARQMKFQAEQIAKQLEMEANQSTAQHAGQLASQAMSAMIDQPKSTMKATPADGGKKSGEVRRGETKKKG